jgi:5-methylcytosine-specific restriction endonuclease McrA
MILGIDFSISAFFWLLITISFAFSVGYYIKKRYFSIDEISNFIDLIQNYLKKTYPQIQFHIASLHNIKDTDINVLKNTIIDDIVNQFETLPFNPQPKPYLKANDMWDDYVFYSKPNKKYSLPPDWLKRKSVVFKRDNGKCQRCFKKLTFQDSDIVLIIPLQKGGNFYLENLALVCNDCKKIIQSKQENTKIHFLQLREKLQQFI